MSHSLKRHALSSFIRFGVRPFLGGRLPYSLQRGVATAVTAVCIAPKGMRVQRTVIGGVTCEVVTAGGVSDASRKTLIWLHGGGYCIGSSRTDRAPAGQFSQAGQVRVVVPDYRLAPEHPHPAALEDALSVYRALLESGVSAADLVVGGDSAGGGLSLALAIALRDAGLALPSGVVFCSPWVDLRGVQQSYNTRAHEDPWLSPAMLKNWAGAYLGELPPETPACSPLLADLQGLPPALIQVGEREILLDDAVELDRKFRASGVTSELTIYPAMWHVFFLQAGLLDEADAAVAQIGQFVLSRLAAR